MAVLPQVMDTPGLLDRPAEDRNEMEKLTYASMAVSGVYVFELQNL